MSAPNLGHVLQVFASRPHYRQQVGAEKCGHKAHNYRILGKGGEELCGARRVHQVGRHEEGAAKEGKVVAEALGERRRAPRANLGRKFTIILTESDRA